MACPGFNVGYFKGFGVGSIGQTVPWIGVFPYGMADFPYIIYVRAYISIYRR